MAEDEPAKGALARAASTVAETVADTVVEVATQAGSAAARLVTEGRRRRRARSTPIANLYEIHPDARIAPRRELGVLTIPVIQIRGTAVEGPTQRGADFLPLRGLRGANWRSRWQRLRAAHDRLVALPPIDVFQTDDGYWVLDGHNRVALAREVGQDDVDAVVTHLHLSGSDDSDLPHGSLEAVLSDSADLRSAATRRRAGDPPGSS